MGDETQSTMPDRRGEIRRALALALPEAPAGITARQAACLTATARGLAARTLSRAAGDAGGDVVVVGQVQTGQRGRPAALYARSGGGEGSAYAEGVIAAPGAQGARL